MSSSFRPCSRTDGLRTEELDGELLVYDPDGQLAIRLNRTAALVWQNADGNRSIADLVEMLRAEVELADEDLVLVALDHLHEHGLIESGFQPRDADDMRLSRRRFIRRVGVVGSAALALPVVTSVVAPAAAAAASGTCYCYCSPCACYCPCYCYGSGTCYCTSCDHQDGSCLACAANCSCTTCYCGSCSTCSASCSVPCYARKASGGKSSGGGSYHW